MTPCSNFLYLRKRSLLIKSWSFQNTRVRGGYHFFVSRRRYIYFSFSLVCRSLPFAFCLSRSFACLYLSFFSKFRFFDSELLSSVLRIWGVKEPSSVGVYNVYTLCTRKSSIGRAVLYFTLDEDVFKGELRTFFARTWFKGRGEVLLCTISAGVCSIFWGFLGNASHTVWYYMYVVVLERRENCEYAKCDAVEYRSFFWRM